MSDHILFDNIKYISAKEAAERAGVVRDYIARLCRDGKIRGRRVGRMWYVDEASLNNFLLQQSFEKAQRQKDLSRERRVEYGNGIHSAVGDSERGAQSDISPFLAHNSARTPLTTGKDTHGASPAGISRQPEMVRALIRAGEKAGSSSTEASRVAVAQSAMHSVSPLVHVLTDAAQRILAVTVAFLITFGTYAIVDHNYAVFARETGEDLIAWGKRTPSYVANAFGEQARLEFASNVNFTAAAVISDPGGSVENAFLKFGSILRTAAESFAQDISNAFLNLVYSDNPESLARSRASLSIEVKAYTPKTVATVSPQIVNQTVVEQSVIERVVNSNTERVITAGGVSEELLSIRLEQLDNKLSSQMLSLSTANSTRITNNYSVISQTNKIDNLTGKTIDNPTITGGTITGSTITNATLSGGTTIASTTITSLVATSATTTNLHVSGSTSLGSLNGLLKAATGTVSALTTSSGIAGEITDETGSGSLVFSASPTLTGTANFANTANSGTLSVTGTSTLATTTATKFTASDAATLSSTLAVTGTSTLATTTATALTASNGFTVSSGGAAITGNSTITGSATTTGAFSIGGALSALSAAVTNALTAASATISGTITALTGAFTNLTATTATTTDLIVTNSATLATTTISGQATIGSLAGLVKAASGVLSALTTSSGIAGEITDETGSGALVFATSPALVTPDLGVPSAAVLTNATGLPISTGVSGLGTGIATFLATPSSANLATAVTDETGTGSAVFSASPTFTGTANFANSANSGTLAVTGISTLATTTVSGNFTVDTSTLHVNSANNRVGIGTASPSTGLDVDTATDISGDLTISGGSALTISATGPVNQTGTGQVTFAGNVDATNGLDVTGANFTVGGSKLTVSQASGNTTVAGTLHAAGALTASSTIAVTGAATLHSTLLTEGALTASGIGTGLSVTNNATIGGTLGVTGAATLSSSLAVSGTLSAGATTLSGNLALGSNKITGLASPTADNDAANKTYVDSVAQGLSLKDSVRAGTTANITLSGEQTIDGVSLVVGNRVLVKDQTDKTKNGIYVVASGAWSRSTDADTDAEVSSGMFAFIAEGTLNANSGWVLTTEDPITLGTSLLTFTQFSGAGQIIAGTGIVKSGNTLDVVGTANRITANADSIDIASTYVGQSSITTVGTLTSGSLGSGFGEINIGSSAITGGAATFSSITGSAITGSGDITISGTGSFTGNVTVSGNLNAATTTVSGNLVLGGNKITGLADPTSAQEAATKAYVDAIAQGLTVKASVRAATTANITLSGAQTVDGVSVIAGDRVLVKNQSTASANGIYVAASGAWSRATDADENSEVISGLYTFVEEGTANANTGWSIITENPITVGSTSITFSQFSGSSEVTAGDGLTKSGNTLNVGGVANRITVAADTVDIASTYIGQSSITTVGTLSSGAISSNFGSINIGSSALTAGAGSFTSITDTGTLTVGATTTSIIRGDGGTSAFNGPITASGNVDISSGSAYLINSTSVLNATTLGANVLNSSLTAVGGLDSGSITTGFGAINIGADTLDAGASTLASLTVTGATTLSSTLGVTGTSTLATTTATSLTASNGFTVSAGGSAITGNSTIAGTLSSLTGLTSSGTITFSDLTASRFLTTNGSSQLAASAASSVLANTITDETGSGALVFATSPALVTPDLGVPSAAVLTNATGLPISTGVSGLGTGIATFLATPSSANLATAVTDETGTGSAVFSASPTFTGTANFANSANSGTLSVTGTSTLATTTASKFTASDLITGSSGLTISSGTISLPAGSVANSALANSSVSYGGVSVSLGGSDATPAFNLADATGLPISTGVSGLGTGIATFLATPSSANLSTALTDETGTGSAVFSASPTFTGVLNAASVSLSGTLGVTGATTLATTTVSGNFTVDTTTLFVDSTNNRVGIGTTTPASLFDVWGDLRVGTSSTPLLFAGASLNNVGIGVVDPDKRLEVFETVADAQLKLSYDATRYAQFQVDSVGDLIIDAQGGDLFLNDENFFVCTGGSCQSGNPTGTGNIVIENKLGVGTTTPSSKLTIETQDGTTDFLRIASTTAQIFFIGADGDIGVGTTTPFAKFSIGANGAITTTEKNLTDQATITVSWKDGNQQKVVLGGNRTINFSNYTAGQTLRLVACQDGTGSRTVTWDSAVAWNGGTAPTLTTTASKCDVMTFLATNATSTLTIFGSSVLNF